jgi:hypothetical protein
MTILRKPAKHSNADETDVPAAHPAMSRAWSCRMLALSVAAALKPSTREWPL